MIRCLDSNVFIKFLTSEDAGAAALHLCRTSFEPGISLVAPPFLHAEVGSVLRKKTRASLLSEQESASLWELFLTLPIPIVQGREMWRKAWQWADRANLPTVYDACYLAATEMAAGDGAREFWTADAVLVRHLGPARPDWVHLLAEYAAPGTV